MQFFAHTDLPTSKEIRFTSKQIQDPCASSYGPGISPSIYSLKHKAQDKKWNREKWGFITYGSDRQDVVNLSGVFILSVVCCLLSVLQVRETISSHVEGLQMTETRQKQNESIWNCC